jgi:alkanesulfonate monooxygenase SsuD/methylene tetrahydromethanopterin reductase-like flavin-dependent oxidoreductase (luciferase family)
MRLWLRYDLRGGGKAVPTTALASAAVEQTAWAEQHGFDVVMLGEHHSTTDGYLPSPMLLGAAMAARTRSIRFNVCTVLPLLNPLRVAEDACVLDNISNGRVELTLAVGYVPSEYAMFDIDMKQRALLIDEGIATLRGAFSGVPFAYRGRQVRVSPLPVQAGGPKLLIAGALKASALRAARLGDGFIPTVATPELFAQYRTECARLGKQPGPMIGFSGSGSIHVSRDPERDLARIGKHLLHELNAYGRWAREAGAASPFLHDVTDLATLKATGAYPVFTPDECLAHMNRERDAGRDVMFNPLCGGLPPDIAWESLELLAAEVLPKFFYETPQT